MDALLSWRKTQASDLEQCLQLHPTKNGAEIVGYARALKAWRQLLDMPHAIESIANGKPVVATYAEVRDANTRGDLQQVILEASWKNGPLNFRQVDEVRIVLGRSYQELFAGYHLSRILTEAVDDLDLWHVRGLKAFQVVSQFEDFHRANPGTKWNRERHLIQVTLESIRPDPHSVAAELFQHHVAPRFGFTAAEQELLELAQEGGDDASIAKALFLSLPAIKRRWSSIFERVGSARPDLCPLDGEGTRGIQKRQRILTYIRTHPEELRPYNLDERKTARTRKLGPH